MRKILLSALMLVATIGMSAQDKLTAEVDGNALNIALQNATSYCAFQMDIRLPEGISATQVDAVADRLSQTGSDTEKGGTKFIVASHVNEDNMLRVIAYNLANAPIEANEGDIVSLTLNGELPASSSIIISNIIFVNQETLEEVLLDGVTVNSTPTGIHSLDGDAKASNIYSLGGARLSQPQKGINIVGGKKVMHRK